MVTSAPTLADRRTRKATDLERDPRIPVHSIVTDRQGTSGEYKVRGRAIPVDDAGVQQQYAEVDDVTFIRLDSSTDDQFVAPERSGSTAGEARLSDGHESGARAHATVPFLSPCSEW
jgi:hypothetical protein